MPAQSGQVAFQLEKAALELGLLDYRADRLCRGGGGLQLGCKKGKGMSRGDLGRLRALD